MNVGEFFVDLGITSSGASTLKDFIGAMGNMRLATLGTIGALGTIGTYIGGTLVDASGAAVAFQKFTNQTGLSAQELQKWQIVAKQANVSASDVASSVFNLQNNLAGLRIGQGDLTPFKILGVSPLGDAWSVLKDLRAARSRVSPEQFTRQIGAMGLSPSMVNVLGLSDKEFQSFLNTAQGMSPQVESSVLKMTEAFNRLWLKIRDVNYEIAGIAAGPLGALADRLAAFIDSKDKVKDAAKMGDEFFGTGMAPSLDTMRSWRAEGHKKYEANRTNNLTMTVNGNTHDTSFADSLVGGLLAGFLNETEAQMPVPESNKPRRTGPIIYD